MAEAYIYARVVVMSYREREDLLTAGHLGQSLLQMVLAMKITVIDARLDHQTTAVMLSFSWEQYKKVIKYMIDNNSGKRVIHWYSDILSGRQLS